MVGGFYDTKNQHQPSLQSELNIDPSVAIISGAAARLSICFRVEIATLISYLINWRSLVRNVKLWSWSLEQHGYYNINNYHDIKPE